MVLESKYGKLRKEDIPLIDSVTALFKTHNLRTGLHGTSLWNAKYKDVDLLVCSLQNDVHSFLTSLESLKKEHHAKILEQRGNEHIGLDYDISIGGLILHVSYVVLL